MGKRYQKQPGRAARPAPRRRRYPPRLWAGAVAVAVLGLLVAGWALRRGRAPREVVRGPGFNVLLVTIDTLRADSLGAYGNRRVQTPVMDRLAREGVVFRQAHAHNVVTLPSHANLLSGLLPFEHGVRDNAGFRFPAGLETLATRLKQAGYRTAAFVSAFTLESRFGLDRGFDLYDDRFAGAAAPEAFVLPERRGTDTVAAAHAWMEASSSPAGPFFAWVHLYDPHAPYAPLEPFASRFSGEPYLGEVSATDAALEPLLAPPFQAGKSGRTLVVLTADHGESLGEHGERTHGIFAYEATLHVPLVLYAPAILHPRDVREPVRHVDVLPTVLDALGLPVPAGLPGRSLLPLAAGQASAPAPSYFEALSGQTTRGWAPLYGFLRPPLKYVELPIPELYDLSADPREQENLVARRPQDRERLQAELAAVRSADRGPRPEGESAAVRESLRALGYLAASAAPPKARYTEEDDPKRLIELDGLFETVLARHRAGDIRGALALCEEVVARRHDMPSALMQLAILRRKVGEIEAAVAALERALVLNPDDEGTAAVLGSYLSEAGRAAEAVRLLEPYAQRPAPSYDLLVAQGVALARLGRQEPALAAFARAHRADPSNAMALVHAATVDLLRGRTNAARTALLEALRLDPNLATAHRTLGLAAASAGDRAEAERRFRRALELDPHELDAQLNLGWLLARTGRTAEARAALERFAAEAPLPLYAEEVARIRAFLARAKSS